MQKNKSGKSTLTDRQKLCCHWYSLTGDAEFSAGQCFTRPEQRKEAAALLISPAARQYLAEIACRTPGKREPGVLEGYRRLAFGPISDAVKLMFTGEEAPPDLDRLDLFSVSELRRGKGILEISFFDRLEALDRLSRQQAEEENGGAQSFYAALCEGAAALEGKA